MCQLHGSWPHQDFKSLWRGLGGGGERGEERHENHDKRFTVLQVDSEERN